MRSRYKTLLLLLLVAGLALLWRLLVVGPATGLEGPGRVTAGPGRDLVESSRPSEAPAEPGARTLAGTPIAPEAAPPSAEAAPPPANELRGLVLDAEGQGVDGCRVELVPEISDPFAGGSTRPRDPRLATTTSPDGRFALRAIPPGEHLELVLSHPEYALTFVPGVVVGERGVHEEPPIVLRRGKRLSGTVTDELGAPIAGARLLLDAEGASGEEGEPLDRLRATTDLDGTYQIHGIPDGVRVLTASAEGFGTLTLGRPLRFEDRIGQAHRRDLVLRRAVSVTGRVVDAGGAPVRDARIHAQDRRDLRALAHGEGRTDASGTFELKDLQPGRYLLHVDARGFRRAVLRDLDAPATDLLIELAPTPALHGRVVDAANGRAVTSFSVRLRSESLPGMASAPLGPFLTVAHAPDGEFALPDLFPGSFQAEVVAPGYAPSFSDTFRCAGEDVHGLVVELRAGAALRGRVVDGAGAPIAGARVECRDDAWVDDPLTAAMGDDLPTLATAGSARSGADGRFSLEHLHPHVYRLRVSAPGHAPLVARKLELAEGEVRDLGPLALEAASSLRGNLVDARRQPVSGGRLFLRALAGPSSREVLRRKSGADGEFLFADLAPGRYALSAAPPLPAADFARDPLAWYSGGGPAQRVELLAGTETRADIELEGWSPPPPRPEPPPSGNLSGRVIDAQGNGLVGVALELAPLGGGPPQGGKSERDGEFAFVRLPPGDYVLRAAGREEPLHTVTIVVDRWTRQDLSLP